MRQFAVSHIPLEADTAALLEHMAGVVGETLLVLHGARTVRRGCGYLANWRTGKTRTVRELSR